MPLGDTVEGHPAIQVGRLAIQTRRRSGSSRQGVRALSIRPPCILLASASPRRGALLEQIAVSYRAMGVAVDETPLPGEAAADYVCRLALAKAHAGALAIAGAYPALGADTAVVLNGDILGKPHNQDAAEAMLARLSGCTHVVLTAVALVCGTHAAVRLSKSEVKFRVTTPAERISYVRTGEPMDKAGGYAIQGLAAVFVEWLSGSYSGVMGLPLFETAALLAECGIRTPVG